MSGPLGGDEPGALLVFTAADAEEVAELLDKDPFWPLGLITERAIRPWTLVYGADRLG